MPIILLILMPIDDDDDGVKHQPNIQGVRIHGHVASGYRINLPLDAMHYMLLLRIAKPNYWSHCKQYFYLFIYLFKFYDYLKNSKNGKIKSNTQYQISIFIIVASS
jgi:hypothetical protein